MFLSPILAAYGLHRPNIDWPLVVTTLWFYAIAIFVYSLVHIIRAPWKLAIEEQKKVDQSRGSSEHIHELQINSALREIKTKDALIGELQYKIELAAERERRKPGPEVVPVYENTCEPTQDAFSALQPQSPKNGPAQITLQNLSEIPALNVQIGDLPIGGEAVGFQVIPKIVKGSPVAVPVIPKGPFGKALCGDIGVLLEFILEHSKPQKEFIQVPFAVSYGAMDGRQFETGCEIEFSATSHRAITKYYRQL